MGWIAGSVVWLGMLGCGGGDQDQEPFVYEGTWAVEGTVCQEGSEPQLVEVERVEGELLAWVMRDDACRQRGEVLWEGQPDTSGKVSLGDASVAVRSEGAHRLHLEAADGALLMRRVYPETGPPVRPDLGEFSLSGQWMMEGYPCQDGLVPQLVQVREAGGSLGVTKVLGDGCIGAGVRFIEGRLDGTSLEVDAYLEPPDDWGEVEGHPSTGRVRVPEYFRLDVLGQSVGFRRVLGDLS
ncbi:hypothetical protein DL240_18370 [Lujinxingia litoralis]|uniref:Uncharacterized protein n=1 Tax=Lujinxingia litoralis TaxID=2211119 RepID=A0A328C6P6_9DELT|nr:hypothetical protein DL240_18370 [Lujinxingia litoralis]